MTIEFSDTKGNRLTLHLERTNTHYLVYATRKDVLGHRLRGATSQHKREVGANRALATLEARAKKFGWRYLEIVRAIEADGGEMIVDDDGERLFRTPHGYTLRDESSFRPLPATKGLASFEPQDWFVEIPFA